MAAVFCPKCGTPRIASFRFCRWCQFDFDALDAVPGAPTAAPQVPPATVAPLGALAPAPAPVTAATPPSLSQGHGATQAATRTSVAATETTSSRVRNAALGIGIVAVFGVAFALAMLVTGRVTTGPDPMVAANDFAKASSAYRAVLDSGTSLLTSTSLASHQTYWQTVARASDTFEATLKAISFPDDAKSDAAMLLDALVVLRGRAAAGAVATEEIAMVAIEAAMTRPITDVADAESRVANDLALQNGTLAPSP